MLLSDHPGKLFYQDSDSSIYILGEHLPDAEPKPVSVLSEEEQARIYRHYEQQRRNSL